MRLVLSTNRRRGALIFWYRTFSHDFIQLPPHFLQFFSHSLIYQKISTTAPDESEISSTDLDAACCKIPDAWLKKAHRLSGSVIEWENGRTSGLVSTILAIAFHFLISLFRYETHGWNVLSSDSSPGFSIRSSMVSHGWSDTQSMTLYYK
jgi:hypothetical protein